MNWEKLTSGWHGMTFIFVFHVGTWTTCPIYSITPQFQGHLRKKKTVGSWPYEENFSLRLISGDSCMWISQEISTGDLKYYNNHISPCCNQWDHVFPLFWYLLTCSSSPLPLLCSALLPPDWLIGLLPEYAGEHVFCIFFFIHFHNLHMNIMEYL